MQLVRVLRVAEAAQLDATVGRLSVSSHDCAFVENPGLVGHSEGVPDDAVRLYGAPPVGGSTRIPQAGVCSRRKPAARIGFGPDKSGLDFRFPSPRPGNCVENNTAHGRFYRSGERWQERAAVILLHGSGDYLSYNFRFPLFARRGNRAGFNVATLVAPFHFQRRPRQLDGPLPYSDCLQLAEGAAQSVAEIRAMTGWLLEEGCPAVALWGFSMGAWYAGMVACRDPRLTSVVLVAPSARMNPWAEQRALRPRVRARLAKGREMCARLNLTALNLLTTRPVIPAKNILMIEGIHDLMCPKDDIEDLWRAWGQPEIWRLRHGHVGVCAGLVPDLAGRVLRWLAVRLEKPALPRQPRSATQTNGTANPSQLIAPGPNETSAAAGSGR
jgi:pimeloyl-ACP methyl ester carboxylesterase